VPPASPKKVLAVVSNKGGVGKTTVSTNLAIYLRAMFEDLPVLVIGLDDQDVIDRMFRLGGGGEDGRNLKHGWSERSFDDVLRLGQYGIHYVPTPPDTGRLKLRAEDPRTLTRILEHTHFEGLVILDTKSDLEALTVNALAAADLTILPVADSTSLEEAAKAFDWIERLHGSRTRGRVLFTLADRRTRVDADGRDLIDRLLGEVDARGWPRFGVTLSRSPRVEALNSESASPGSILHHASGTLVHRQMRELAEQVAKALDLAPERAPSTPSRPRRPAPGTPVPRAAGGLKRVLLRGWRSG
jgi:cellulose biosynthesis protein BcsQ